MKIASLAAACWVLSGCATHLAEGRKKVSHLPPTAKDVLEVILSESQSQLTGASCQAVGTEATDRTVGQYLAGFLAELSDQKDANAVTTSVERGIDNLEPVFLCRAMIRHAKGEDVWSWGVQFLVRQRDGEIVGNSLRCIGAG